MAVLKNSDMEVELRMEGSKAVIAGKTSVPFSTFVRLVLERKLGNVLKSSGEEPIVLGSELLTALASAPQDSRENQTKFTLVTLGSGVLLGVFLFSLIQIALLAFGIASGVRDYGVVAGILAGLVVLVLILERLKRRKKADKITEAMERLTSLFSK